MKIRTLMLTAAGVAALTVSACNRDAADKTGEDVMATDAAEAGAPTSENDAMTGGSGAADASGGSGSGGSSAGGSTSGGSMSPGSTPSPSVGNTGSVDSAIPADAPSRNTRETAGAAGSPNAGQDVPYAYSPTNPAVQPKR